MPRKSRDYKAEYARAKARAKAAGFKSEREYKRARKGLSVPRAASPVKRLIPASELARADAKAKDIAKIRREARRWSATHSHVTNSQYVNRMTDAQVIAYHRAYVEGNKLAGPGAGKAWHNRLKEYMVDEMGLMDEEEFENLYGE